MTYKFIDVAREDRLTIVTINRPAAYNALNAPAQREMAQCGGCCSCATCHVHIDHARFTALPPMNGDEDDLLDGSSERTATSRLACQLPVDAVLDGAHVTIAAGD